MSDPETDLKAGDIVRLKSGGPNMTLDRAIEDATEDWYCFWFVKNSVVQSGRFSLTSLVRVGTETAKQVQE